MSVLIMNAIEMRNQLKQYIDQLSPKSLGVVAELIADLVAEDSEDAIQELLAIEGFAEAFKRGKEQIKKG